MAYDMLLSLASPHFLRDFYYGAGADMLLHRTPDDAELVLAG